MVLNEKQIIVKLKDDDMKSFDKIFHYYYPRVFSLAFRFLHSREEAQEIVQNVFVAIWENRQQIDESKNFSAYIQSIARHLIYNQLKKAVYQQRYIDFSIKNHSASEELNAEDSYHFKQLQEMIGKAIEELPVKRREIFYLSRSEGLSYKEIATKLSVTESTVNTQISKAIEYLRKKVRDFNTYIIF